MSFVLHNTYFNSQPHEEADEIMKGVDRIGNYFNSQPHEEADHEQLRRDRHVHVISTHSLTKRLTKSCLPQSLQF